MFAETNLGYAWLPPEAVIAPVESQTEGLS